jgi:hypothetical protein
MSSVTLVQFSYPQFVVGRRPSLAWSLIIIIKIARSFFCIVVMVMASGHPDSSPHSPKKKKKMIATMENHSSII